MSVIVSHYGLHSDPEGVAFLHQGRSSNNFIGLKKSSPFEVQLRRGKACPHLINQAAPVPDRVHWTQFLRLLPDPLVQAMLPIPKDRMASIPYVNDPQNALAMILVTLSRMASPIYPAVLPLAKVTPAQVVQELSVTNVCPLVLTGAEAGDTPYLLELARESRFHPRRMIITGDSTVVVTSPLERIQTALWDFDALQLAAMPMESLGAMLLRRHARGEPLDAELVREAR